MLSLVNIKKDYIMSDDTVHALKGININFRRSEFVAILGHSGCGKTTLLNIIGGLDKYSDGELIIEGRSTKSYKATDWDTYRNHSIGFVFQSYNLIGHISILANVELALTISGVSKSERKKRALKVLEEVGLKGQEKKKPNQLSGGQCQRVAIARALINDPEILLADEPTGALDSNTSVQIMELLKEIAKDRLVIMVTHNPDLAKSYATRIVKMSDGLITSDSKPFDGKEEQTHVKQEEAKTKYRKNKSAMSFKTALGLSFTNLLSKKGRTILISFAGSIGIIGIALILSLSYGFNNYITSVQTNAMSTYPLTISKTSSPNLTTLLSSMSSSSGEQYPDSDEVGESSTITDLVTGLGNSITTSDTQSFKAFLELEETQEKLEPYISGIQYVYSQSLNIYALNDYDGTELDTLRRLYPIDEDDSFLYSANTYHGVDGYTITDPTMQAAYNYVYDAVLEEIMPLLNLYNGSAFGELLDNQPLLEEQFDVLEGRFPEAVNEVVIKVDTYNNISDLYLYSMGLKDMSYIMSEFVYTYGSSTLESWGFSLHEPESAPAFEATFDDLMNLEFALTINSQYYEKVENPNYNGSNLEYIYQEVDDDTLIETVKNTLNLEVVGIVRQKESVTTTSFSGAIGYSAELYEYLVEQGVNPSDEPFTESEALKYQMENPDYDIFTGELFATDNTYSQNLTTLGYVDLSSPDTIYIYPVSFEAKDEILAIVEEYNNNSLYDHKVYVEDSVGTMLDAVQTIVDGVSYVLIAFVSISLVVSSIMIGIITYVSVLERTKEIGILRAIGARKKDISRVFNAETLIIGLTAGLLGIAVAALLDIPIMLIINSLVNIGLTVIIPWYGAVILPIISICLTMIAGLIPARLAAKKDPVIALRSE